MIQKLKEKVLKGCNISYHEAIELLKHPDKEELYAAANEIRIYFTGNFFELCTIANAKSGKCSENCKWCAQSAHYKTNIEEYELIEKDDAIEQARSNRAYGVNKFSLVTSGKSISKDNLKKLCDIYDEIESKNDITLCASMGLLDEERLLMLKKSVIEHYHCNLETAPSFFSQLCTTHTFEQKVETIKIAQRIGMEICSGGIIGMGETAEQRIELAIELQKLNVQSIPLNILNPIEGTPLAGTQQLSDEEILTAIALFRFINPKSKIRFAGGRALISHIQDKAMKSGINAALVGDLLTTIGSNVNEDLVNFKNAGFSLNKNQ